MISVVFSPASTGSFSAAVSLADNATGSPQSVTLTGTGTVASAPVVTLTPSTLTFTANAGTSSAAQSVTLSNTGNAALNISSIAVTGTNASVFSQTNICGTSLAANTSCNVSVVFAPTAVGSSTATLTFTDNAANSPQSVALNGTAMSPPTFTLTLAPSSLTVSKGVNAVYVVTVTPQGGAFTNPIALSISGLPANASATFSPATLTPGSTAATTTLTIPTADLDALLTQPARKGIAPVLACLCGMLLLPLRRKKRALSGCLVLLIALIAIASTTGCGTAAKSYTFTVTGASQTAGAIPAETQTATGVLTVR